jgi:hypothetical protein
MTNDEAGTSERRQGSEEENEADLAAQYYATLDASQGDQPVSRPLIIGKRNQEMSDEDFDAADEMSDEDDEEEMVDIQEGNGEEPSIDTGRASTDDSHQNKDRRPNQLKPVQEVILEVDPKSGLPKLPEEAARGYGNTVACILRDTVTVNEQNIRQKLKKSIAVLLISKLHARYQFPSPYNGQELTGNVVNTVALGKMSKALSGWKTRLRAMITAGGGFEEVHKHYPQISED